MKSLALLLGAVPLVAAPFGARAQDSAAGDPGLRIESRVDHYTVDAESFEEVAAVLNGMRLEGEDRPPAQGLTQYDMRPQWRYRADGVGCVVTEASVDLSIVVTLPRWPRADQAAESERARWREVIEAITRHENTHRDITVEEARVLLAELRELRAATCTGLGKAVDGLLAITDAGLSARHAAFDRAEKRRRGGG